MDPTRIVPAGLLVVAALVVGCSRPQPPAVAGAKPGEPAAAGDPKADAGAFATSFLKAVNDGTATPAMLTPEFKKVIAEPVFGDDQAKGYSDDAAEQWLKKHAGTIPNPTTSPAGTGDAFVFVGAAGAPPRRVALRVVRTGGTWRADSFTAAAAVPSTSAVPA